MKKKFLSLMLSFTVVMSMTACGGGDSDSGSSSSAAISNNADTSAQKPAVESEPAAESAPADENADAGEGELVNNEANGLQIALPADFTAIDSGVEGKAGFANADKSTIVLIDSPVEADGSAPDQITEETFLVLFQASGYEDVAIDNIGVVEQPDGGSVAVAYGTAFTGEKKENVVMQFYFTPDGSEYYVINYLYSLDDAVMDDLITEILASVTATGTGADVSGEAGFSLWDVERVDTPELAYTTWSICGGYLDGVEMTEEKLDALLEAYSGICQFEFDAEGGVQMVQGAGGLTGTYEYLENGDVGVILDANGEELRYGCIFTDLDGLTMIAISDDDGQNGLFFAQ